MRSSIAYSSTTDVRKGHASFLSGRKANTAFFSQIQPKLAIGQPGDKYEVEADAMADSVVQKLQRKENNAPPFFKKVSNTIQPKCNVCTEEVVQRKEIEEDIEDTTLEQDLRSSKGTGTALSSDTRSNMETAFDTDFSKVRIHTGSNAVQMSQNLNAQAFTHGSDVYFNHGKYNPNTNAGQHLLAHELTHVVQQKGLHRKMIQRDCVPIERPGGIQEMYCPPSERSTREGEEDHSIEVNSDSFTPIAERPSFSRIRLPDYTLTQEKTLANKRVDLANIGTTLFSIPTEIGVVININGNLEIHLACSGSIQPIRLTNIIIGKSREQREDLSMRQLIRSEALSRESNVTLDTYREVSNDLGQYIGNADMHFGAHLSGSLAARATLEAEATFAELFGIASASGGIETNARVDFRPRGTARFEFGIDDGGFELNKHFTFSNESRLSINVGANLNASFLGWEFLHETIPLLNTNYEHTIQLGSNANVLAQSGRSVPGVDLDLSNAPTQFSGIMNVVNELTSDEVAATGGGGNGDGSLRMPRHIRLSHSDERGQSFDTQLGNRMLSKRGNIPHSSFDDFRGSNVAVFKYYILPSNATDSEQSSRISEGYESRVNISRGLHSEFRLLGVLEELQRNAGPNTVLYLEQVFSERCPCARCRRAIIGRRESEALVRTKHADIFYIVPYSGSWIQRNRNLMRQYGLTPPSTASLNESQRGLGSRPDPD